MVLLVVVGVDVFIVVVVMACGIPQCCGLDGLRGDG